MFEKILIICSTKLSKKTLNESRFSREIAQHIGTLKDL